MAQALTPEQKAKVAQWVAEGATLADVQKRLTSEFNVSLTYMDTRFLLDDLNLTVKDAPQKPSINTELNKPAAAPAANAPAGAGPLGGPPPAAPGGVRVEVDKIVRPGSVVSGNVTFSDGMAAEWYLDQSGRLGLLPKTKGYQPKSADVQEFQYALQEELAKLGY